MAHGVSENSLVVMREQEETEAYEFWKIESCFWESESTLVKCYVGLWNGGNTKKDGIPRLEDRISTGNFEFEEIPEEVQEAFFEEMERIEQLRETLLAPVSIEKAKEQINEQLESSIVQEVADQSMKIDLFLPVHDMEEMPDLDLPRGWEQSHNEETDCLEFYRK